jgi:hypothetical protein
MLRHMTTRTKKTPATPAPLGILDAWRARPMPTRLTPAAKHDLRDEVGRIWLSWSDRTVWNLVKAGLRRGLPKALLAQVKSYVLQVRHGRKGLLASVPKVPTPKRIRFMVKGKEWIPVERGPWIESVRWVALDKREAGKKTPKEQAAMDDWARRSYRETMDTSLQDLANKHYSYWLYRTHSGYGLDNYPTDPAARREWIASGGKLLPKMLEKFGSERARKFKTTARKLKAAARKRAAPGRRGR